MCIAGVLDGPTKFLRGLDRIQEDLGVLLVEDIRVLLLGEVRDGFAPQLELVKPIIALLIDDLPVTTAGQHLQHHSIRRKICLSQHHVTACRFHLQPVRHHALRKYRTASQGEGGGNIRIRRSYQRIGDAAASTWTPIPTASALTRM